MIPSLVITWLIFATINLLWQTYKDVKTNYIDERSNYYMMGLTIALGSLYAVAWYEYVIFIGLSLAAGILLTKYKIFGDGDYSAVWIFFGFFFLGYNYLVFSLWLLPLLIGVILVWKRFTKQEFDEYPFYAVFLVIFIATSIYYVADSVSEINLYCPQGYVLFDAACFLPEDIEKLYSEEQQKLPDSWVLEK